MKSCVFFCCSSFDGKDEHDFSFGMSGDEVGPEGDNRSMRDLKTHLHVEHKWVGTVVEVEAARALHTARFRESVVCRMS